MSQQRMMKENAMIEEARKDPAKSPREIRAKVEKEYGNEATTSFVYTFAVVVLGILAVLTALAGVVFIFLDPVAGRTIPDSLVAMGSAAVGALVGIFVPSPAKGDEG